MKNLNKMTKAELKDELRILKEVMDEVDAAANSIFGKPKWLRIFEKKKRKKKGRGRLARMAEFITLSETEDEYYASLHYLEPEKCQSEYEICYDGYERQSIDQSIMEDCYGDDDEEAVFNTKEITFPQCTYGKHWASWVCIGLERAGRGMVIFSIKISSPPDGLDIWDMIQPEIARGALTLSMKAED